eukprot:UC1_evm1s1559
MRLRDRGCYYACRRLRARPPAVVPQGFRRLPARRNLAVDVTKVRAAFPALREREMERDLIQFGLFDETGEGLVTRANVPMLLSACGHTASEAQIDASWTNATQPDDDVGGDIGGNVAPA